jgi:hypothetical protein
MTNFFEKAQADASALEESLLGPNYKYYDFINTPADMGMSSDGSISTITKDIAGIIGYVTLLSSGGGRASKVNGPLGNKFFLETGAKCTDKKSGELATRSIYVNNQPDGSIPFISSGIGDVNFSSFKGLIPGTLSNLSQINPMQMFQAFMSGTNPECQAITMETIDVKNNKSTDTAFVTTNDIKAMSSCWFSDKKNPVSNKTCKETFTTMGWSGVGRGFESGIDRGLTGVDSRDYGTMPNDVFVKLYYSSLGLLLLYIFMRLFQKKN